MARRLVGRALEVRVAETAVAARAMRARSPDIDEIGDQRLLILGEDLVPGGTFEMQSSPFAPARFGPPRLCRSAP